MAAAPDSDLLLVTRSAQGHRPAFAQIVERYQALVCSVAYSATGSVSRSEDVAQETFIAAWRGIGGLREPQRLRAWLCGIARNLAQNERRVQDSEPASDALPIEALDDHPAEDEAPLGRAMREEEQAILWRAIGRIPEVYREPLVMFYREQKSISHVAAALELSEDAVKQRLTRGRRLLQDQVAAFVEGALARSGPGKAFTLAVIAALPTYGVSTTASAAVLAAHTGTAAKSAGGTALALGLAGPAIGAVGSIIGLKLGLDAAQTEAERRLVRRFAFTLIASSVVFSAALMAWIDFAPRLGQDRALLSLFLLVMLGWSAWFSRTGWRAIDVMRRARRDAGSTRFRESRSAISLLGLPLWHVYFGVPPVDAPPARGWIAIGDRAVGGLFALGTVALAPVSVGMLAIGGIAVGGVAIGGVPMGAAAFGGLALAGAAAGWIALGGYSVAWKAAAGGVAVARDFATGGHAVAQHANDLATRDYFMATLPPYTFPLMLATLAVLALVPAALFAWRQRRALRLS